MTQTVKAIEEMAKKLYSYVLEQNKKHFLKQLKHNRVQIEKVVEFNISCLSMFSQMECGYEMFTPEERRNTETITKYSKLIVDHLHNELLKDELAIIE